MIVLGVSQTLNGGSTNAATVNFTVSGLLTTSASPPVGVAYQVLAQGQLGAAVASMYGPGGSNFALISSIMLFNTGATTQIVTMSVNGIAVANNVATLAVPATRWAQYEDGNGWSIFNASGVMIGAVASTIAKNYSARVFARHTWR